MKKIDRKGMRFGRLVVIAEAPSIKGRSYWLCKCECGVEKTISSAALTMNMTSSCGCLGRERRIERSTKHGKARRGILRSPEYNLWIAAKQRAKRRGIPFSIEVSDVVIPQQCPVFNTPLCIGTRKEHNDGPSLDRVDSEKGYTLENIWVISYRANRIKNDATLEELTALVDVLRQRVGNGNNSDN